MSTLADFPHERRVQRYAFLALAGSIVFALLQSGIGPGRLLGIALPIGLPAGIIALSGIIGIIAILRRMPSIALTAAAVSVIGLAIVPASALGLLAGILALLYGGFTLAFAELVHVTQRYERAHRAVEDEHVPEASLNRVTDETLKTLASRAGIALLMVGVGVAVTNLLAQVGPQRWREAVETTGPLGVAIVTLTLFGVASLYIMSRGATLRDSKPREVESDVVE